LKNGVELGWGWWCDASRGRIITRWGVTSQWTTRKWNSLGVLRTPLNCYKWEYIYILLRYIYIREGYFRNSVPHIHATTVTTKESAIRQVRK